MSQLTKVLQVMDLFSAERTTLSAEQIAEHMQLSRPTAFRYVKELCDVGLLLNMAGVYALGPRIIEWDYCVRASDPILAHSRDALRILAGPQSCMAVLVTMYGEQVIYVHSESGLGASAMHFTRGRSLPLLRGAASKAILAYQATARLKRIYQSHIEQPDALAIAASADEFVKYFRNIRQQGYYISRSEVETAITGIAAPIVNVNGDVTSCLSMTFNHELNPDYEADHFVPLVQGCAREVSQRLKRSRAD